MVGYERELWLASGAAAAAAGCGRELSVALGLLLLRSAYRRCSCPPVAECGGLCVQAVADVRLLLLGGVKTL